MEPEHPVEPPPYAIAPPADTLGLRHVREMLRDLEWPQRTSQLRERVGAWRVPITGAHTHTLSQMLEGVRERTFHDAGAVADAIADKHPELRD